MSKWHCRTLTRYLHQLFDKWHAASRQPVQECRPAGPAVCFTTFVNMAVNYWCPPVEFWMLMASIKNACLGPKRLDFDIASFSVPYFLTICILISEKFTTLYSCESTCLVSDTYPACNLWVKLVIFSKVCTMNCVTYKILLLRKISIS